MRTLVAAALGPVVALAPDVHAQDESEAAAVVAAQVRSQGFACADPATATRDAEQSKSNEPVWLLECADAKYRVRIVPDQGADISTIK
jgi:hypothetical protein